MNSTPKQQDGDDRGVAPASGARPSLEQTVLGVAPAAATPESVAPSASAAVPEPAAVPELAAVPEPLAAAPAHAPFEHTPPFLSPPPVITSEPVAPAPSPAPPASAPAVVIAAPVIVVAGPSAPTRPAAPAPAADHPGASHSEPAYPEAVVTAAPQRSVETSPPPSVHVAPRIEVTAPPRPAPRDPSAAAPPAAMPDRTLPVGAAAARAAPAPAREPSLDGNGNLQRTALSEDYLREARQAALDAVAFNAGARAAAPSPALGDTAAYAGDVEAPPTSASTRPSIMSTPLPREIDMASTGDIAPVKSTRGFEPVPVLRAQLSESLSGGLGPVAEVGGLRSLGPASSGRARELPGQRGDRVLRWLLLTAVALISIASVMVGQRILHRYREAAGPVGTAAGSRGADGTASAAASTARALMPTPAPAELAAPGKARVVSATGAQLGETPSVGSIGPESQLAATAGRHVIAGNYAEALPLYQQLQRAYPENTAYVAMARVLEKKVGSANDTLTVTPAATPVKK